MAGASAVPVVTGTADHLTGYLPLALTVVAAVLTGPARRRTLRLPGWDRRTSRDARVRT